MSLGGGGESLGIPSGLGTPSGGSVLGGALAGGASLAGSLISANAATSASDNTLAAVQQALALEQKIYNQNRTDLAPWTGSGSAALGRLDYLLGLNSPTMGNTAASFNSNYGPQGTYRGPVAGTTQSAPGTGAGARLGGYSAIAGNGGAFPSTQTVFGDSPTFLAQSSPYGAGGQYGLGSGFGTVSFSGSGANDVIGSTGTDSSHPGSVYSLGSREWSPRTMNVDSVPTPVGGRFSGSMGAGPASPASQGASPVGTPASSAPGASTADFGSLMHDFGLSDFQADPGYQFRLQQGAQALERSAAAKGGLYSGGELKDLTDYNQGFASNEFSNAYNRYQNNRQTKYNFLAGVAGLGQGSAQTLANSGTAFGNNAANTLVSGTLAAGNQRMSGYNAIAGGVAGLPGTYLGGYYAGGGWV